MRALGATNRDIDWTLVDGIESVAQRVLQRVQYWLAEWFLDTSGGVPYNRDVLGGDLDLALSERAISDQIRAVPDVVDVEDARIEYDAATRALTYSARVRTAFGIIGLRGPAEFPVPLPDDRQLRRITPWSIDFGIGFGGP